MRLIAGIEEAGRGPAIGPMVMCIAIIEEGRTNELIEWGVKDSKLIAPKKREYIHNILIQQIIYKTRIISPLEIDMCLKSQDTNLNWLEADVSAKLTNQMLENHDIKKAILDCPSNNTKAYADYYKKQINKDIEIISEHKADVNYPIVSAASIIAKVTRDKNIDIIKKKNNIEFGSGYTSDKRTINFLKEWYIKYKSFPEFVRKSWKTIDNIKREIDQKKLESYFK